MRSSYWMFACGVVACTSPPADVGAPPTTPDASVTPDTNNVVTFAVDTLSFGDVDESDHSSTTAWRTLGYDLDGKLTTKTSTDVCGLFSGAPKAVQVDGTAGIDNAFASSVLPIILTGLSSYNGPLFKLSDAETSAVQQGRFTFQIQVTGLTDDPRQSAIGLGAAVFLSDAFPGTPTFDQSTTWPVLDQSVLDGVSFVSGPTAGFDDAYVNGGTFVAGMSSRVTVPLRFVVKDIPVTLTVHSAIIAFQHVDAGDAANGIIAGVIAPSELNTAIAPFIHRNNVICGAELDGITTQMDQAADIFLDRYNVAGLPCNGISVAFGFHAKRVANPTTVVPTPALPPDPCDPLDAGTD